MEQSTRASRPTPIPAVLRTAVTGRVVFPTDPDWGEAALTWDLPAGQPPHALVVAESAADVQATMAYAVHHGLRVAPQGNGTHPASLGDLGGTILLRATVPAPTVAVTATTAAR